MTVASVTQPITTAEQLLAAGDIGRCELVHGRLIMMSPASWHHGSIAARVHTALALYLEGHRIGELAAAETGFLLSRSPDTVRAPDVAFVRRERLVDAPKRGFFPGAPDLAVEVLSPDDAADEVLAKTQEWLEGGAKQVWLVDPKRKTISICRGDQAMRVFRDGDELLAEDLLPGFRLRLVGVFA